MQVLHVGGLEGHRAAHDGVEQHAQTPGVNIEAFVALFANDFRRNVGGRAALLVDNLPLLYDLADSEITNLYTTLAVK